MRVTLANRKIFSRALPKLLYLEHSPFQPKFYLASKKAFQRSTKSPFENTAPSEFSLEDFKQIGLSEKEIKPSDFLKPIRFFNSVLENNTKLNVEPELLNEKINKFLVKLEEIIEKITDVKDLETIHKFAQNVRIPSEKFWITFFSSALRIYQKNPTMLNNLTDQILISSEEIRNKFNEVLPKMINKQIIKSQKWNFFLARKNLPLMHKWLIFKAGYDLSLKFDLAKDKSTFNHFITPEFLNTNDNMFPYVRRHFQALTLSEKISTLNLYSALYHNSEFQNEIRNILKRVSKSLTKNIEKLSSLQLLVLTQIFIRAKYNCPPFWNALEKYILFRLETDFSVNYLIKYLQGFSFFKTGSIDLYMEIDRYIGFHAEELTARDLHPLVMIYAETGKGRHKLFSLLELKILEFKKEFALNEVVDFMHCYASLNYLTPKLFVLLETKIIEQINSLNENQILKVVDALRLWQKPSPIFDLLKTRIHQIIKSTDSENFLICILATYLEQLNNQEWYNDIREKTKTFLGQNSANFLLKLGGLLVKVSKRLFDEDLYNLFGAKCKELEANFIGKEKKDIHFILWKLGLKEQSN